MIVVAERVVGDSPWMFDRTLFEGPPETQG